MCPFHRCDVRRYFAGSTPVGCSRSRPLGKWQTSGTLFTVDTIEMAAMRRLGILRQKQFNLRVGWGPSTRPVSSDNWFTLSHFLRRDA